MNTTNAPVGVNLNVQGIDAAMKELARDGYQVIGAETYVSYQGIDPETGDWLSYGWVIKRKRDLNVGGDDLFSVEIGKYAGDGKGADAHVQNGYAATKDWIQAIVDACNEAASLSHAVKILHPYQTPPDNETIDVGRLNEIEQATILAALRSFQRSGMCDTGVWPEGIEWIIPDGCLGAEAIDRLCERINLDGLYVGKSALSAQTILAVAEKTVGRLSHGGYLSEDRAENDLTHVPGVTQNALLEAFEEVAKLLNLQIDAELKRSDAYALPEGMLTEATASEINDLIPDGDGWCISETSKPDKKERWELQMDDESGRFEHDLEATQHVLAKAQQGGPGTEVYRMAIEFLKRQGQTDYQRYFAAALEG